MQFSNEQQNKDHKRIQQLVSNRIFFLIWNLNNNPTQERVFPISLPLGSANRRDRRCRSRGPLATRSSSETIETGGETEGK